MNTNDNQSPLSTHTLHVNGITITYDEKGTGALPVIFIHGFPFNRSCWQSQMNALGARYRAIAYDLRGFGDSESGTETFTIDQFATDLIQLMDGLKIQEAVVCGLSMGGYIVMNAVTRFPERFKGIVLCDTQCIADSEENKEKRFKTIEQIRKEGLENFTDAFVKNIFYKKTLDEKKELVEKIRKLILSNSAESICATLKALAERHETCTKLKSVTVPALILCGKEDTVTPLSQSELLNNTLSNSTLYPIENAGHMSNLEQPEAFNKHLLEFLDGING